MKGNELPLGFGMALAQNETAMKKFESLTESEKQSVLQQAHHVNSKREMQQLVSGIAAHGTYSEINEEGYPTVFSVRRALW